MADESDHVLTQDDANDAAAAARESMAAILGKRQAARASVPFKAPARTGLQHTGEDFFPLKNTIPKVVTPEGVPAIVKLDKITMVTERAMRNLNGGLFKLEPDAPVEAGDIVGEFIPDRSPVALTRRSKGSVQRNFWDQTFVEENLTLEDLLPYRVRVAWRIAREIARLKGLIADDEQLNTLMAMAPDPWQKPTGFVTSDRSMYSRLNKTIAQSLRDVALLPPKLRAQDAGAQYDPSRDIRLQSYLEIITFISKYLFIEHGSKKDPAQGRYGLYGLLDQNLTRLAFPSRLQILAWEDLLTTEVLHCMAEEGQMGAEEFLRDTYGLRTFEIDSVVKLAKGTARRKMENDLEDDRAVMVFQLDDVARRAKDGLDLRVELAARKQQALVLGLGRTEAEDQFRDFLEVVDRVSGEDDAKPNPALLDLTVDE
jgi:hypothetical protein